MSDATVVVRAKDEAASIGRTLDLVAGQTADAQVVVVDSGSSDDTVGIARRAGAEVIEIPAASFTYGGALNTGAEAARAAAVAALGDLGRADDALVVRSLEALAQDDGPLGDTARTAVYDLRPAQRTVARPPGRRTDPGNLISSI